MRLARQSRGKIQYHLSEEEAQSLVLLMEQFPAGTHSAVRISKTDPGQNEREKLLNESLAAHRKELRAKARELTKPERFKKLGTGRLFTVSAEEREAVLQILNDIRIESWRLLGEPENTEMSIAHLSKEKLRHYVLMCLAGDFEHEFLILKSGEPDA